MAIHEWWAGDGDERYWLEITNRSNIGEDLIAPKYDDAGNEYWSYALVSHVRTGDVVFHWDKNAGPGITSFSVVTSEPRTSRITWQSRGTYGRTHAATGPEPAWRAELGGLVTLPTPLTQTAVRGREAAVERVRDALETRHGKPIYFPFAISDKRPIRAAQGYLVRFPRALVDTFPELRLARDLGRSAPEGKRPEGSTTKHSADVVNKGRMRDAKRKKAIEMHAVTTVMAMWKKDGYKVEDVGLKRPWDITAIRRGEEVHIEVKGSSGTRDAVDLTDGEVRHAEDTPGTVLVVVDQIVVADGNRCSGGRVRVWSDWAPDRGVLVPTAYRYPLPTS